MKVQFNRPFFDGQELKYLEEVLGSLSVGGGGVFTVKAEAWIEKRFDVERALLTTTCTAALEMAVMLADIGPGDEVIMPSFTISSMANAVVLRGGIPVFVDIRPDTLCLDERQIEEALSPHTRAIMPMHYAGVACEMTDIKEIADRNGLVVIEDAAHAFLSSYKDTLCGRIGDMAAISFHETKNVVGGEAGVLLINRGDLVERAEILLNIGTNRSRFQRGEVEHYEWLDIGSSYLPSELTAACLFAQLEKAENITSQRREIWQYYHDALEPYEIEGKLSRPVVPTDREINGHIFYILLPDNEIRERVKEELSSKGIDSRTHYVPLHSAPAGRRHCRTVGTMDVTNAVAERLLRLPVWVGIQPELDWLVQRVGSTI
jgi:dTDP-4-amino-4,6-dideoxygalactose transaminase